MKDQPTYSSIALAEGSDLRFGGEVRFDVTVEKLKGGEYPMVYVEAYQGDQLVYGQLDHPEVTFILGGGSSLWHQSPGPADCKATLLAYGGKDRGHDVIRTLAGPVEFHAEG